MNDRIKLVANNKKAYHDYFIDDKYEAGIELFGTEVKSIRMGKCSVKEAFLLFATSLIRSFTFYLPLPLFCSDRCYYHTTGPQ